MFKRLGSGASNTPQKSGQVVSVIGADMRITGNIQSEGQVQVDGQLDGDITCHTLVVGESGRIAGEVVAQKVRFHGQMKGRITAESVVMAKSARMTGDLIHATLEIEAGAQLEGHILRKEITPALPAPEAAQADSGGNLVEGAVPA